MKNGVEEGTGGAEGGVEEEKIWLTSKNERLGGFFIWIRVGDPPTSLAFIVGLAGDFGTCPSAFISSPLFVTWATSSIPLSTSLGACTLRPDLLGLHRLHPLLLSHPGTTVRLDPPLEVKPAPLQLSCSETVAEESWAPRSSYRWPPLWVAEEEGCALQVVRWHSYLLAWHKKKKKNLC